MPIIDELSIDNETQISISVYDDDDLVIELEDSTDYAMAILPKADAKKLYELLKKHYED